MISWCAEITAVSSPYTWCGGEIWLAREVWGTYLVYVFSYCDFSVFAVFLACKYAFFTMWYLTCFKRNIVAYDEDQSRKDLEKALKLQDAISDLPPVIPLLILLVHSFPLKLFLFTKFSLSRWKIMKLEKRCRIESLQKRSFKSILDQVNVVSIPTWDMTVTNSEGACWSYRTIFVLYVLISWIVIHPSFLQNWLVKFFLWLPNRVDFFHCQSCREFFIKNLAESKRIEGFCPTFDILKHTLIRTW